MIELQLPLFPPPVSWVPPNIPDLPSWAEAKRVCVDVETWDPDLKELGPGCRRAGSHMVGVAFAIEDGPSYYLPTRHAGGGNLDENQVIRYLAQQAAEFKGDLVGANLSYDIDWLSTWGIQFKPRWFRDIQVADPLIWELHESYSLQAIAERHQLPGKDTALLKEAAQAFGLDSGRDLGRLHSKYVGAYGEQDAALPLIISRRQEREIDSQGLWEIYNLESRVLPVLVNMRQRGVRIDFDKLAQVEKWSLDEEAKALAEVKRLTGIRVAIGDVWKAEALAKVLRAIGVKIELTPSTKKPKVTKEILGSIDHEAAALLRRARKVNKLRTTFAESVRRFEVKGRIHCTFNQLRKTKEGGEEAGGRYGRLSSSEPNLQQQPGSKDKELGKLWRSVYVPDEGSSWACLDFSQQEPRWAVHFAELAALGARDRYVKNDLKSAIIAANRYRTDPDVDNHQMMADIIGIDREPAKIIFLGLLYGMGEAKCCHSLGLPTVWRPSEKDGKMKEFAGPQGAALLARFHDELPFLRRLSWMASSVAEEKGYVTTVLGRRCRFPEAASNENNRKYDWTHKALNRVIQGSSADQTKLAMVIAEEEGFRIQLQVHDEFDLSVRSLEEAAGLAKIMKECVKCRVPMKVDIESGPSWGEAA